MTISIKCIKLPMQNQLDTIKNIGFPKISNIDENMKQLLILLKEYYSLSKAGVDNYSSNVVFTMSNNTIEIMETAKDIENHQIENSNCYLISHQSILALAKFNDCKSLTQYLEEHLTDIQKKNAHATTTILNFIHARPLAGYEQIINIQSLSLETQLKIIKANPDDSSLSKEYLGEIYTSENNVTKIGKVFAFVNPHNNNLHVILSAKANNLENYINSGMIKYQLFNYQILTLAKFNNNKLLTYLFANINYDNFYENSAILPLVDTLYRELTIERATQKLPVELQLEILDNFNLNDITTTPVAVHKWYNKLTN